MSWPAILRALWRVLLLAWVGSVATTAWAVPEARILGIDATRGIEQGEPLLTTLIDLSENRRISDIVFPCRSLRGRDARYDCEARELEKPMALFAPTAFPRESAMLLVRGGNQDRAATLVDVQNWQASRGRPRVGTAWLILLDADGRMGKGLADAKQIAAFFLEKMGPGDLVDVVVFSDRQVIAESKWTSSANRNQVTSLVSTITSQPSSGKNRPLSAILRTAASDALGALGASKPDGVAPPLHQAMLVLSSGFGGADPATTGPGGMVLTQYLTEGYFPEPKVTRSKRPVPVISLLFPLPASDPS